MNDFSVVGWENFCLALMKSGVVSDVASLSPDDPAAGPDWDSFRRAQLLALLRRMRPQLTDECLASIETLGDACGWVSGTAPDTATLLPCRLQPVMAVHYPQIYQAATTPPGSLRWRFRGATPSPREIGDLLHQGTLCHFVVLPPGGDTPEGYVALYNAQLSDGWAYFGFQRLAKGHPSLMYEATFRFFDHCFRAFNLRRIYVEIPGYNLPQFESILDDLFEIDSVMEDRDYLGGRYWPVLTAHLDRDRWRDRRKQWVELIPGASPDLDEVPPLR